MSSKKLIILMIAIFIAGIFIGGVTIRFISFDSGSENTEASTEGEKQLYSCGMHPDVISEEPGNCPICGMKLTPLKKTGVRKSSSGKEKGKILYYRAPMDPTYISEKPGKSPMGMDLVPVYEGEEGGGSGNILIDPTTVQNMGIKTATVERQDLTKTIRAMGNVTYNEKKLYTVNARISGWIEKLYVNYTGQRVKKGEPLLAIYSPELVSAQEEYLLALKNNELVKESSFEEIKNGAQSLLEATRKRFENWDIPLSEIEKLKQRGTISKTITLVAPTTGFITHKNAVEGVFVKEGSNLYQIADLSSVWVEVSIYEYELPWIKLGMEAEMELTYLPGKKFKGDVSYIYPYLNQKTRDIKVRLDFPNPKLELKPDMYSNVTLKASVVKNGLVIPSEAVIRSGVRNLVFVTREAGKFEPREITLGPEGENGYVQVVSGLLEGEQIVTSGQFLLDSESNAQEAIRKMLAVKKMAKDENSKEVTKTGNQADEEKDEHEGHAHQATKKNTTMKSLDHENGKRSLQLSQATALYTCPMHPEFVSDDPNQRCPVCEMKLEKKKDLAPGTELYTCPMDPQFVTDDPEGRCSICEMKLVKKNID